MDARTLAGEFVNLRLSGRTSRLPFWCVTVFSVSACFAISLGLDALAGLDPDPAVILAASAASLLAAAYLVWLFIAVSARRFHDFGRTAWCVPLLFIPIVSVFAMIWAGCSRGSCGTGAGDDPAG